MDPQIGRRTWRTLEPIHGAIYFVPEATEEYARLGLGDWGSGYFASRAAALGAVGAEVVKATFYNFDPGFVERSMDRAWETVTPEQLSLARLAAADRMMVRLAGGTIDALEPAAEIARAAALTACERPEGRALFAGHAQLDWPEDPHLVLWHAQTLLREFRGDGHVAALTAQGLSGCEALVTHAAAGEISGDVLKSSRQRTDEDWATAYDSLRSRGWLDAEGAFTDAGREGRQWIEERTDELAVLPYAAIGEDACEQLRAACRSTSAAMAAAIGFPRRLDH
ncbi:hypothetical protein [uncultured Ilumatobacter sp.]|uniref:SCO6745 family protein n=1 Tax=uncultured Ilumatobacter sp. TaxID=879968 RepID=UPI00374E520F